MDPILHFDQATWLAKQVVDAERIVDLPAPFVALPGARRAIAVERLHAHHEHGDSEAEIVERVNGAWDRENGALVDAHAEWAAGPYHQTIVEMREKQAQAAARELRRLAALEKDDE
jgi:hypothetical protein